MPETPVLAIARIGLFRPTELFKNQYERLLAQDLSRQQWDGCFPRNVLAVLEYSYNDALAFV